jgi:hypothetical protein
MAITIITQFLFICTVFFLFFYRHLMDPINPPSSYLKRGDRCPRIGSAQPLTNMIPKFPSTPFCAKYLRVKRGFD